MPDNPNTALEPEGLDQSASASAVPNEGKPNDVCRLPSTVSRDCQPTTRREQCADDFRDSEANRACVRDVEPRKNRSNGEEQAQVDENGKPTYAANHTKGMPHNAIGEVEPRSAYEALLKAVDSELPADFEAIPLGPNNADRSTLRWYVDPQGSIAYDLEGPDSASPAKFDQNVQPVRPAFAPTFADPFLASEMGEVYLKALLREVPLSRFVGSTTTDGDLLVALDLINQFTTFSGPVDPSTGKVTPQLFGRGGLPGDTVGPYLSQLAIIGTRVDDPGSISDPAFASRIIPPNTSVGLRLRRTDGRILFGTNDIDQRVYEVQPGLDFMTDYNTWLSVQQGVTPAERNRFTGRKVFIRDGRQLAGWVHFDPSAQFGLHTALLLLSMQERATRTNQDLLNPGNPYLASQNQEGFATFGNPHVLNLVWEVATRALKGVWYVKWFNERRIRPEGLGGRINNTLLGSPPPVKPERYGINKQIGRLDTQPGADILRRIFSHNNDQNAAHGRPAGGTFLLPQAFPEGSPMHPAYVGGHSVIAGAWATVIKGLFNGKFEITDPTPSGDIPPGLDVALIPSDDGTGLVPYRGPGSNQALTLEGEVNKMASNVAFGRNWGGVHYRSDDAEGLRIGEYVGVSILQEQARGFNPEHFFELTLLNGITIRIRRNGVIEIVSRP